MSRKPPRPRLIVLSAPSGAGKTTLCKMLLDDFRNVILSISVTTRSPRPGEKEGVDYHFVSPQEFQKKVQAGELAEWATVHGHSYGTLKSTIDEALAAGKHVLFDIDVQGAKSLKLLYKERVLLVFVHPPSMKVLENRLLARGSDAVESIETRMRNAYNEVEWSKNYDYQLVNDDLGRAYQELKEIINKECH
ncbi:MAG: guanylate kinase [Deltaproteobacteria bacterium]|nr:guanylate kinase [Deltaproteobacteria bacterium]